MTTIDQLRTNSVIEFAAFDDWKGYASAMGFHLVGPAEQPGFCRMRRDLGVVHPIACPQHFTYRTVS